MSCRKVTTDEQFETLKSDLVETEMIEVDLKGSWGCIMSLETWLDDVNSGALIDYDGYGHGLDSTGEYINYIRPSMVKNGEKFDKIEYVLWFNR